MQRVAVFCGSSTGTDRQYRDAAGALGRLLGQQQIGLVYGGGSVGLMGIVADAVMEAEGEVIGVIPRPLATRELLHTGVADMRIVDSMHDRKSMMAELSDAFIALPGGLGTFEELFEAITWSQLGIHAKGIGLLNVSDFFAPLVHLIDHSIEERFIRPEHRGLFVMDEDPSALLDKLQSHKPPDVRKWLAPDEG